MKKFVDDFIDFGPGREMHWSNIHIEYYKPLKRQIDILREDMFMVDYGNDLLKYMIDVGWYGESFSTKGFFKVYLVRNQDWQNPLLQMKCKSIKRLVPIINLCLARLKLETNDYSMLSVPNLVL